MLLDPGQRVGAYEIVGPLGAGGMGEVYQARDTRLGRQVAIKFISDELAADPTAAERLAREARLTSSLNHPNIVTVYDVGELEGRPYIVMELVVGRSLHDALAAGRMPFARVADIACQVATGLAAAHDAGVVHRDLKPRNIMLTEDSRAKIVDFGLGKAKALAAGAEDLTIPGRDRGLTGAQVVMGTAGYMAPEQVQGRPVDFRADQFALGGIIYEMITGRRAFKRDSSVQTMAAIVDHEPQPIAELCPDTPAELLTVVERCLAKDPANRYGSTQDLARDLRDAGRALADSRASWRSGPSKAVARRRWMGWAVAAVTALALAMAGAYMLSKPGPPEQARPLLDRYDKVENVDRAIALLEPFVAANPSNQAALVSLAEGYVRKWEYTRDVALITKAEDLVRAAVNLNERDAPTHVVWAMINSGHNLIPGALSEATRAIELDPKNSRAWRELGRAQNRAGQPDKAEEALRKAVALGPADWTAHNSLGAFYYGKKRFEEAAREFQLTLDASPLNVRAYNNLGAALFALDRFDEARGQWTVSMKYEQNATAYSNLGTTFYYDALYADAAEWYEKATTLPGATYQHWHHLGAARYWASELRESARGAYETAVKLAEAARENSPKDPGLLADLADAYAVLGLLTKGPESQAHKAAARRLVTSVEQLHPEDPIVCSTIASTYEELGDRVKALEWLDKAIKAGYSVKRIERSPWLQDLRSDERYQRLIPK